MAHPVQKNNVRTTRCVAFIVRAPLTTSKESGVELVVGAAKDHCLEDARRAMNGVDPVSNPRSSRIIAAVSRFQA